MVLKIGNNTAGYNNLIRKADVKEYRIEFTLGKNDAVNKQIPNIPSDPTNNTAEKKLLFHNRKINQLLLHHLQLHQLLLHQHQVRVQ